MGIRRIEAGILDNLSDFDPSTTPFEAGLGAFIDLDKEGFIGREALLQADRRSLLFGVKCSSAQFHRGAEFLLDGNSVGVATAADWSPYFDCGIGYVKFNEPGDWAGRTLAVKTRQGELVDCEIVTLPFYDADKLIPRGLGNIGD